MSDGKYACGLVRKMETAVVKKKRKAPLTRFGEFELLKAIAIIGLPLVHVMEEALEADVASKSLIDMTIPVIGLCAFGPSVFMICMGFGIGGGKTSYKSIRESGLQFLLIGFLLNIVRWFIPGVIQEAVIHTRLIDDINYCLQSDIYYFVGLYFVFYSFMKQHKIPSTTVLMISIFTLTVNDMLTPFMHEAVTNDVAASLIGNIIYVNETSCFPLMSWMVFPTVGIIYGEVLKKSTEEYRAEFMRKMVSFSALIFIAVTYSLWTYHVDVIRTLVSPANDYITDLPNVIMLITLANVLIGLTYYLCQVIGGSRFMAFMLRISAFIIPFYLLQWVLCAWVFYGYAIARVPRGFFGIGHYFVYSLSIMAICIWASYKHGMKIMKFVLKITTFKKKKKKKKAKTSGAKEKTDTPKEETSGEK